MEILSSAGFWEGIFLAKKKSHFTEPVTLYSSCKSLEHCDHLRVDSCRQITGKAPYHSSISGIFSWWFYINNIPKNN